MFGKLPLLLAAVKHLPLVLVLAATITFESLNQDLVVFGIICFACVAWLISATRYHCELPKCK